MDFEEIKEKFKKNRENEDLFIVEFGKTFDFTTAWYALVDKGTLKLMYRMHNGTFAYVENSLFSLLHRTDYIEEKHVDGISKYCVTKKGTRCAKALPSIGLFKGIKEINKNRQKEGFCINRNEVYFGYGDSYSVEKTVRFFRANEIRFIYPYSAEKLEELLTTQRNRLIAYKKSDNMLER